MRIGELFAGYGGLGMGVQAVIGGEIAWFSEFDAAPSKILAHHFPGVPNHGDITKIDWPTVEPVDVLTGGFPCQDVSLAGARKGMREGTRSGLWSHFATAIDALKPSLVVIENVRGLLSATAGDAKEWTDEEVSDMESAAGAVGGLGWSDRPVLRALGAVLGDLAELGYDAEWVGLRAADAGAPHARYRVFIVAHARGHEPERRGGVGDMGGAPAAREADGQEWQRLWDAASYSGPTAADPAHLGHERAGTARGRRAGLANSGDVTADADSPGREQHGRAVAVRAEHAPTEHGSPFDWGQYWPAIERWEAVMGRIAPAPTKSDGKGGAARLSPEFVEHMMGLPAGHVTNPAIGITRNEQLKALGNGVVWQQAALAIGLLLGRAT